MSRVTNYRDCNQVEVGKYQLECLQRLIHCSKVNAAYATLKFKLDQIYWTPTNLDSDEN